MGCQWRFGPSAARAVAPARPAKADPDRYPYGRDRHRPGAAADDARPQMPQACRAWITPSRGAAALRALWLTRFPVILNHSFRSHGRLVPPIHPLLAEALRNIYQLNDPRRADRHLADLDPEPLEPAVPRPHDAAPR